MHRVLQDFHKRLTNKKIPLSRRMAAVGILAAGVIVVLWLLGQIYGGVFDAQPKRAAQETASRSAGGGQGVASYASPEADAPIDDGAWQAGRAADSSLPPPLPPEPGSAAGERAEAFEVTEYYAAIETRALAQTCEAIRLLKAREEVIFEDANEFDTGCRYRFKVRNESADDVRAAVEALAPDELREHTYTIQPQLERYADELSILTEKLATLKETLAEAQAAYQELVTLATAAQDAESVAAAIDSRVRLIERLAREQLRVQEQIDRLARRRAQARDRLSYTFFTVSVREDLLVDFEALGDSWKRELTRLFVIVNEVAQGVTIVLAGYALMLFQLLLYVALMLLLAKYGWRFVKEFWRAK